ncbi:uncharacterized protein HRG_06632 [Hirsutella rhossiliensis]|uniref:Uncharacterized protein n=1 Tax=Hirsutella rhossiliensis TaxID=111463 RepID=A0A9P8MWG1_9HYPO|nr:uncharacterized protein HRG_06632 [Hirsutella rhossiliensis]KAH0962530.1 hypothetical protein HRG_06632 [Hirsutella rhossiliensis]
MMPSGVRQRDSYTYKLYGSHCEAQPFHRSSSSVSLAARGHALKRSALHLISILTLIGVSKIVPGGIPTKWRPFVVSDSRMIPAGGPK